MDDKCSLDPQRSCDVRERVGTIEAELNDLRRQNAGTHERFGERIGQLESHNQVQDVKFESFVNKLSDVAENLREMKADGKETARQMTGIVHKLDSLSERYKDTDSDVDELKAKPAKRWESMTGQIISILVAALIGFLLSQIIPS